MKVTLSPTNFINKKGNSTPQKQNISFGNYESDMEKFFASDAIKNYALAGINIENGNQNPTEKNDNPKQVLTGEEFFINMKDYQKNEAWAKQMADLTHKISSEISSGRDFDSILCNIENGVSTINKDSAQFGICLYALKRFNPHVFIFAPDKRGCEYIDRYYEKYKTQSMPTTMEGKPVQMYMPQSNEEYKDANVCKIGKVHQPDTKEEFFGFYQDPTMEYGISNLFLVRKEFNKLKRMENPTKEDVMRSCAIIQWLIAQETPYYRGSDSVANVLTKAIMHAHNIHINPVKEGMSLDFEALDTDLDDYIEKYPDFFED